MTPAKRIAGIALLCLVSLLFVCFISTRIYIAEMYDGRVSKDSLIDGLSFSVQTVTTIGYGNWESPIAATAEVDVNAIAAKTSHIRTMRGASIFFMIAGSAFYALLTGLIVAILSLPPQEPT